MKFNVIYADPPWSYRVWSGKGKKKSADNHYNTMSIEDIKSIPVQDICNDDCVLFLWVTWPNLLEGLDTITAWGFSYKTCGFNWVKTTKNGKIFWGLGYYTRANSEVCLIATRGNPGRVLNKGIHQIVMEPCTKHSEKPPLHKKIELLYNGPYIELFARKQVEGWTCIGNEITGNDILVDIKDLR